MDNLALEMEGSHHLQGNGIGMMSGLDDNNNQSDASPLVTFNVGGSIFQTTEDTLALAQSKNRNFKVFAFYSQ